MRIAAILTITVLHGFIAAEIHLSGDISAVSFDSTHNPFVVDSDIVIPAGMKAVIGPGCVFLFNAYTSLHVSGSLSVEGDSANNVVFTSINDNAYNMAGTQAPNPFDWNGIVINANAEKAALRDFKLMFSVFGIKSMQQRIEIKNGLFRRNGRSNLTIAGKAQAVEDNILYSFGTKDSTAADTGGPAKDTGKNGTLFVRSEPTGAAILLDGKPLAGVTPLTIEKLRAGQYTVRTVKENMSAEEEVVVKPSEIRQLSLTLATTKTGLKVISSPLDAEVYLNKRPGKRTFPDNNTPMVFPDLKEKNVTISFFKIGFRDTAISMPVAPYQMNNCFVELSRADGRQTARQKQMVAERRKVGLSYYFFGASAIAGVCGGASYYFAHRDFEKAREAKHFLETTVLDSSSPLYQSKVTENKNAGNSGNIKQAFALTFGGLAACMLGTGLVFYF